MHDLIGRESRWGSVRAGRLGASGAPGHGGVSRWVAAGANVVVTLQRQSEMNGDLIAQQCREKNIEWVHLPLRGRDSLANPTEEDQNSIQKISLIVNFLRSRSSVIVHCSAGMHRTGFVCYLALRLSSLSVTESLQILQDMRIVTYEQILLTSRKHPKSIQELAEEWFVTLNQRRESDDFHLYTCDEQPPMIPGAVIISSESRSETMSEDNVES
jgi:protein-tyrosine phosphatase